MPIDDGVFRRRHVIGWMGAQPPDEAVRAFVDRDFIVKATTDSDLNDETYLSNLMAVIFIQSETKPLDTTRLLASFGPRLLDHDCRVVLRASPRGETLATNALANTHLPANTNARDPDTGSGDSAFPHVRIFESGASWPDVANYVTGHPAGPAPNWNLVIKYSNSVPLPPHSEILIRRAFSDCAEIHLTKIDDGHSGVAVFRAFPELSQGQLGRFPLPYFLKIGSRPKVFEEYQNYRAQVDPYVPFHLGPHLVLERCCLGARDGLIVGDFVEESESLVSCAREGRAAAALACLFDRTLRSWHREAREDKRALCDLLRLPSRIPENRLIRARELGATRELVDLQKLLALRRSSPVLVGAIHGDLHAANVRVRGTDAIVIDFYANDDGPLIKDPAALEASLLVDCPGAESDDTAAWLISIADLYEQDAFLAVPEHANPKVASSWLRACVRQIRMYAHHMEVERGQYATALAAALLFKASKDPVAKEPENSRRAAAYVIAERLLSMHFESSSIQGAA